MSRRDELLAGVKTINRRSIDEREASEKTKEIERERLEREPHQWVADATGESGPRIPPDPGNLPANEASLESILKAQINGKSEALQALELEIADCESSLRELRGEALGLKYDIQVATEVLGRSYADDWRDGNAKGPVPQPGPSLKNETKEES